jgi:Domain of unknown function (DUF4349)
MPTRLRSRRAFLSVVALSAVVLAACGGATSPSAAPAAKTAIDTRSSEAPKPAAISPTSMPRPAATPAPANRPAAESDAAVRTAGGAAAAPAPAAQAKPAAPPQPGAAAIQPPVPPTPARPADPAPVSPAQAGRMVIYTTEVSLLVTSPSQLVSSLGDVVAQAGGYIAGVENKEEGGVPVTTVLLKIPPDRYEPAMRQIRGLAVEVTNEKATTQDVTEEFSDVQTQLRALEASHAQLLELLGKAQNIEEILKIQEKLAQTKTQIDRLKGRETFLQRSTELATITVNARPAEEVLARTFSTLRSSLRRAEAQRAQTLTAIQRARTPEEEATLRDRLGEVTLEIDRLANRLGDVENKARAASITLPTPPQDDPAVAATTDQDLLKEYLRLVGERRAAEAERDRLTREQRQNPSPELSQQLQQALLRVATLDTQTKAVEERARRASIALPSLSADQIAALAGLPPESWWSRLEIGWIALVGTAVVVVAGLGVLVGRRLFRRPTGPAPSAA